MTTLFLADVFFPDTIGGAGRVARHLAEGLAEVERTIVVCRNPDGKLPDHEHDHGLEIRRFTVDTSSTVAFFTSAIKNCAATIGRLRARDSFERAVLNQPLSALAAARLTGELPTYYVFHSPWSEEYVAQTSTRSTIGRPNLAGVWLRRWLEGWLLRRARRIMVMSNFMRSELHRLHKYADAQVLTIPGGVDLQRYSPGSAITARRKLGLPAEAEVILTVRNLVARMGLPALIEAASDLFAERPRLHLVIAGDGPLKETVASEVIRRGMTDRVHLLGRIPEDDLPDLYRSADLFVLPTESLEGFGLVTIEALASGTPVVATPVGASPEILEQLDARLICRAPTPDAIAQGIRGFFERELSERHELRTRGRTLCERLYGWKRATEAFNNMVLSSA